MDDESAKGGQRPDEAPGPETVPGIQRPDYTVLVTVEVLYVLLDDLGARERISIRTSLAWLQPRSVPYRLVLMPLCPVALSCPIGIFARGSDICPCGAGIDQLFIKSRHEWFPLFRNRHLRNGDPIGLFQI